jgi:hypothetical protein
MFQWHSRPGALKDRRSVSSSKANLACGPDWGDLRWRSLPPSFIQADTITLTLGKEGILFYIRLDDKHPHPEYFLVVGAIFQVIDQVKQGINGFMTAG